MAYIYKYTYSILRKILILRQICLQNPPTDPWQIPLQKSHLQIFYYIISYRKPTTYPYSFPTEYTRTRAYERVGTRTHTRVGSCRARCGDGVRLCPCRRPRPVPPWVIRAALLR